MKKVKKLIALAVALVMLTGILPGGLFALAAESTSELKLVSYGNSGNASGTGVMVATGVYPDGNGSADKAPYVANDTGSRKTNLASTRIGVMAFSTENADVDTLGSAILNVYVNGVNGNVNTGWLRFAVYETSNPSLTYALGGMNQSSYAAVNNDYSYDAAMWSNEKFTNSGTEGATAGWATIDVTEAVVNAVSAGKSQVVLRFQVPTGGLNLSVEGDYEPYIELRTDRDATPKAGEGAVDINALGYRAVNSKNLIDKSQFDYTCNTFTGWSSGGEALGDNFTIGEGYNDSGAIYAAELAGSTAVGSINPYIPLPEHTGEETFILSFAVYSSTVTSIEWSNAYLCDANKNQSEYVMGRYDGTNCKYAVNCSSEWTINRVAFTPKATDKYIRLAMGWASDVAIDNISIVKAEKLMVEVSERYVDNTTAYDDEPVVLGYGDNVTVLQYGEEYITTQAPESIYYGGDEYLLISNGNAKLAGNANGEIGEKVVLDYRYVKLDDMFMHPGVLNTEADLERIAKAVKEGKEPYLSGYNALIENSYAQIGSPRAVGTITRGGSGANFALLYADAHRAYLCAIRWKISGDTAYADCARDILNAWSASLKTVTGNADRYLTGIYSYQLAAAAELMRDYEGFELERMQDMLITAFYKPLTERFLYSNEYGGGHNGAHIMNYWANWDLCNMAAATAIGVFCDRRDIYDRALEYYKFGPGNGSIYNAVPKLYEASADTIDVPVGQWQESGRDMEHTQMGVGLMAVMCEIAWNQGDDLYGWANNRFMYGAEYVAQYHAGQNVPYTEYNWYTGSTGKWSSHAVLAGTAGVRPVFEMIYNHYKNRKGLDVPGMEKLLETVRPEGGAGGHASSFDQLGFGTLLYTREAGTGTKAELPESNVPEGLYRITSRKSGKAIAADSDGYVRQYAVNEDAENQLWRFTDIGGGVYVLTNKATGKVMSIENDSYANAELLTTSDYDGKFSQQFAFMCFDDEWDTYYSGYYRITPVGSGLSLDVRDGSTADGVDILQYTYNSGTHQQWELTLIEQDYELAEPIEDISVISGNEPIFPEKVKVTDGSGYELMENADWNTSEISFTNNTSKVKTVTVAGSVAGLDISVNVKIYPETFTLDDILSKNSQRDADASLAKFPVSITDEFVMEMDVTWNDFGDQWIMLKDSSNANYFGPDQIEVGVDKTGGFRPVNGNGSGGRVAADVTMTTLEKGETYRVFIKGNASEDNYTVTLTKPDGEAVTATDYGFRSNADVIDSIALFANTGSYDGAFSATDIKVYCSSSDVNITVNYAVDGKTVYTEKGTYEIGETVYDIKASDAFYINLDDEAYIVSAQEQSHTAQMGDNGQTYTVELELVSENAVLSDTFATVDAAVNNESADMVFVASAAESDAPDTDADGNVTVTGTGWNLGNPRIPLLTFNVPEDYEEGKAVKLNVYVAKVHTHLLKGNSMKLAAGSVDFVIDENEGYSVVDVADTENLVWSDNAITFENDASQINEWVTIDVTDFVQNADGTVTFTLYAPKAAAYVVDRENATMGGAYEGMAAYLEVVDGETIATTGMEKVTKMGSLVQNAEEFVVPCDATVVFYIPEGSEAYAVSNGTEVYDVTDYKTEAVDVISGKYYPLEEEVLVYSTADFEAISYNAITNGTIDMDIIPYEVTDNVIGITASDSEPTWYDQFNIVVRFKPDGTMDAYNGKTTQSYETVAYEANKRYHLHIETDVEAGLFSAWITDEDGNEYTLALNYAYRASAPAASDVGKLTLIGGWNIGGEKFAATNIVFAE